MFHAQKLELPSYMHRASLSNDIVDKVWALYQEYLRSRKQCIQPLVKAEQLAPAPAAVEDAVSETQVVLKRAATAPTWLPMQHLILVSRDPLGSRVDHIGLSNPGLKVERKPLWDTSTLRYREWSNADIRGATRVIFVVGLQGFCTGRPASHTVGDVEDCHVPYCEVTSVSELERQVKAALAAPYAWAPAR